MNISLYFPNLFKDIYGFIDGKTVDVEDEVSDAEIDDEMDTPLFV